MNKQIYYRPLTATPFKTTEENKEKTPCETLRPYIKCFWGSESSYIRRGNIDSKELIIPDTCVDIIYYIDYTNNTISGGLCGLNDQSFYVDNDCNDKHLISVFGIRFYAWSAYAFSDDSLKSSLNGYFDISSRFKWLDQILKNELFELKTLEERAHLTEKLLLIKMDHIRKNDMVDNTVKNMILNKGSMNVEQLAKESFISSRQLERIFNDYVGITPKKLNNLIRYQLLWNEILENRYFNILNAVCEYGYTDQSHLMREFKRYHTMDIQKAKALAYQNVGNIQDLS